MAMDIPVEQERMLRRAERLAQRRDDEVAIRTYLRILSAHPGRHGGPAAPFGKRPTAGT